MDRMRVSVLALALALALERALECGAGGSSRPKERWCVLLLLLLLLGRLPEVVVVAVFSGPVFSGAETERRIIVLGIVLALLVCYKYRVDMI